jgi:hypothetical protein
MIYTTGTRSSFTVPVLGLMPRVHVVDEQVDPISFDHDVHVLVEESVRRGPAEP